MHPSKVAVLCLLLTGCAETGAIDAGRDLRVADVELASGAPAAALQISQDLIAKHPDDVQALIRLARAQRATGRRDAAEATFRHILRIDSDCFDAKFGLAGLHLTTDPDVALSELQALSKAHSSNASILVDLGVAHDMLMQHAEAQEDYHQALSLSPEMPSAQVDLGLSYALSHRSADAVSLLGPLAQAPDAPPRVREDFALAVAADGRDEDAKAVLGEDLAPRQVSMAIDAFHRLTETQAAADVVPPGVPADDLSVSSMVQHRSVIIDQTAMPGVDDQHAPMREGRNGVIYREDMGDDLSVRPSVDEHQTSMPATIRPVTHWGTEDDGHAAPSMVDDRQTSAPLAAHPLLRRRASSNEPSLGRDDSGRQPVTPVHRRVVGGEQPVEPVMHDQRAFAPVVHNAVVSRQAAGNEQPAVANAGLADRHRPAKNPYLDQATADELRTVAPMSARAAGRRRAASSALFFEPAVDDPQTFMLIAAGPLERPRAASDAHAVKPVVNNHPSIGPVIARPASNRQTASHAPSIEPIADDQQATAAATSRPTDYRRTASDALSIDLVMSDWRTFTP